MESGEKVLKSGSKISKHFWTVQHQFLRAYENPSVDLEGWMAEWGLDWARVMRWKRNPQFAEKLEEARGVLRERTTMDVERAAALGAWEMVAKVTTALRGAEELKEQREES